MSEWIKVGKVSELVEGVPLLHDFEYETALIVRIGETIYAIEDRCSHDGNPLADGQIVGCTIACARHGAKFDLRTGDAVSMPAVEAVSAYPTKVDGDDLYIQAPEL